jgi:phosphoglycerate dehydrogenase-like enzyme
VNQKTLTKVSRVAVCSRSFSNNEKLRTELLSRYSDVTFNDKGRQLEEDELVSFLRNHDKAITALEKISEKVLMQLPELMVISKYGVGLDMIDLNAMRKYNKRLGWTAGVNRRSVAELTLAFAISMLRNLPEANREVLSGTWRQKKGGTLSGRTVGIIGCGNIGKDLVLLLQPFNCKILVNDIVSYQDFYSKYLIDDVSLEELLLRSDVVTLHVPLDNSTRNILSADRLSLIRAGSILINTARGGLVDEIALKPLLMERRIAAAFDVFDNEPPLDKELLNLPNLFATPHIGGSSEEAILAMGMAAIYGLDDNAIPE